MEMCLYGRDSHLRTVELQRKNITALNSTEL